MGLSESLAVLVSKDLDKKYYVKEYGNVNKVFVEIDGNRYDFEKPIGKSRRIESLIFKNLNEDYIKVVKV